MALPLWNPTGNYGVDNSMNNLNNQTAYLPGTNEDKMMKSLYEMKSTYGDTPAYQQNLQKDWDNYKKTGEPLSLPKKEYSGVEGFASTNNVLNPDFSQVNKASMIPDGFIDKMKSLWGGITNTDAAQTMNINYPGGNPYYAQRSPHTGFEEMDLSETVTEPQKKGSNSFGIPSMFLNMLNTKNPLSERSSNYNSNLAGQIEDLNKVNFLGTQSSPYQIAGGPLAGKNLVSMFGTNDYDQMLGDKKAWFEKRIADKKDIGESRYQAILDEITAREAEKKARDDAAAATRTRPQHHGDISRGGGHQAANIRSISDQGPGVTASSGMHGGRHYAYGGRVGYNRGGRVGILAAF